jgi:hypothetical protein
MLQNFVKDIFQGCGTALGPDTNPTAEKLDPGPDLTPKNQYHEKVR